MKTTLDDGCEAIYDRLYGTYFCALCSFAHKYVRDEHVAADIVQQVFVTLWKMRDRFHSEQAARSFLYISVRNSSLNYLRSIRHRASIFPPDEALPRAQDEPDELLITAELERQLLFEIEQLPTECRRVLQLSLRGKSYKEIGELMRIAVSTVHSQRVRAVKLLRKALVKLF